MFLGDGATKQTAKTSQLNSTPHSQAPSSSMAVLSKASAIPAISGLLLTAYAIREHGRKNAERALHAEEKWSSEQRRPKTTVNKELSVRFLRLFKIILPGPFTAEVGFAALIAVSMALRSSLDIAVLHLFTSIERAIVSRSQRDFMRHLRRFLAIMVPMSCVNSLFKYGRSELSLRFRTRLTRFLYDRYLTGFVFYNVSNRTAISNPDQLLTIDVERFSDSVVELYVNVSKPALDIAIYAAKLTASIGVQGPVIMLSYLVMSGVFLTWLRQPMGRLTSHEQQAEGKFRYMNSRLTTHSEEIAFYNGNDREKQLLGQSFQSLVDLVRKSTQFRIAAGAIDTIVAKYLAIVVGYYVVSKPFMDNANTRLAGMTYAERMEDYFRSGKMMISLAEATGRLVLSSREVTRAAGFTARLSEMMDTFGALAVETSTGVSPALNDQSPKVRWLQVNVTAAQNEAAVVLRDNVIQFENVPLVTPTGDVLVAAVNFRVEAGMNVVVVGPNGCGKSSLFRTLGGLWPLRGGKLTKPKSSALFYIPQRPYLPLGNLRDQVIYPHSQAEMAAAGRCDGDLMLFLEKVRLHHLVEREGGWNAVQDWTDVLSGGEKQRLAMARLFYHKPQFAILDECTSAVSVDVEGEMYSYCRQLNITLLTVSHRKSLWQYHEFVLQFDGQGGCDFQQLKRNNDN